MKFRKKRLKPQGVLPNIYHKIMEYKIGEIFEYEGIKLEVVKTETYSCSGCYFINLGNKCYQQVCMCSKREDKNNVIFQFVGFIK